MPLALVEVMTAGCAVVGVNELLKLGLGIAVAPGDEKHLKPNY